MNIFQYLSDFSFRLTLVCNSFEKAEKISKTFSRKLERSLKYGKIDQGIYAFRKAHISVSDSIIDLKDCNLVIESVSEDEELKKDLFQKLDQVVSEDCILASNSSSIPPSKLITNDKRNHNTIGLHFFYPLSMTNLVEVNVLESTSCQTLEFVRSFLDQINRFHLVFSEKENFTLNKLFLKLQAGSCYLHQHYKLSYLQIDTIIKNTLQFPIGVFEFFDHVGIDTMLVSVRNYVKGKEDAHFYAPLIQELESLSELGKLGRKSGQGFYSDISENTIEFSVSAEVLNEFPLEEIKSMIVEWYFQPIIHLLSEGICTKEQIEHAIREYIDPGLSPFDLAKKWGIQIPV